MRREEDPHSRALYEMRSMIGQLLRLPVSFPSISCSSKTPPAAFGLLFIGISISLMLLGILTFFIGLLLMPLVFMLFLLFYFVRIVSKVSQVARSILYPVTTYNYIKYGVTQAEVYQNNQEPSLTSD